MAGTPVPTPFPTATSFPPVAPDDMFGARPDELRLMDFAGIPQAPAALAGSADPTQAAQSTLTLEQLMGVTGGAVGPGNDPTAWTPDEAAEQSNVAITKIATVNPDLAAQLQAQRTGEPDTGGGFLDSLKGAVASVAGLPGIKQVLDWSSRPAQIIPELLSDREGDSFWGNVGQALGGNSEANWHRVLADKLGIDGPLGAILGFGLDVALDPLTYVGSGMLSLGRATVTRNLGKIAFGAGDELGVLTTRLAEEATAKAAATGSKIVTTQADVVGDLWKNIAKIVHPDAAGGTLGYALREGEQQIILGAKDTADAAMKYFARGGRFQNLAPELAEHLGVDPGKILEALELARKAGGGNVSRTAYDLAKSAAAVEGGMRFKFSMPMFNLRYVSPAIPGSAWLADHTFQLGRQMFSGMSGTNRMMKLASMGGEFGERARAAYDVWATPGKAGGFSALKKADRVVADKLSRGVFGLGGYLYGASEAIGRTTAHFGSSAMLMRGGGLGAMISMDARIAMGDLRDSFGRDAWAFADEEGVYGEAGKTYRPEEIQRLVAQDLAPTTDVAAHQRYINYRETGDATGLSEAEKRAVDTLARIEKQSDEMAIRNGVRGTTSEMDYESASAIHPTQEADYRGGGAHPEIDGEESWYVAQESPSVAQDAPHIGNEHVTTLLDEQGEALGRGVVMRPGKAGSRTAAPRVRNTLVVDARVGAENASPGVNPMDSYTAHADDWDENFVASAKDKAAQEEISGAVRQENRALIISEQARKDGYDSILRIDKDGNKTLVVLDTKNAAKVTPDASPLVGSGDRLPVSHVLTREIRDSIRGQLNADELQYSGGMSAFEAQVEKEIGLLRWSDAEERVRELLTKRGIAVDAKTRIFEHDVMQQAAGRVSRNGDAAVNAMGGRMQRKLDHLGFGGAYNLGGHTDPGYRFTPPDKVIEGLGSHARNTKRKLDRVIASSDRTKKRQWTVYEASEKLARTQDRLASVIEDIKGGMKHAAGGGRAPRQLADVTFGSKDFIPEAGKVYHTTTNDGFEVITEEGLKPFRPGEGRWVDGSLEERLYAAPTPQKTMQGNDVMLRWNRKEGMIEGEGGELFQHDRVAIEELEYMDEDGVWRSVKDRQIRQKKLAPAEEKLESIQAQRAAKVREVEELEDKIQAQGIAIHDALNEHNRMVAATHTRLAEVIPAIDRTPGNRAGFAAVNIPGFENTWMPAYMAAELNQAARGVKHLSDFRREWRRFTGLWKTWATWMNPGFHLRNIQGAWFNSMLGGVTWKDHVIGNRVRRAASEMATKPAAKWKFATTAVPVEELNEMGLKRWAQTLGRDPNYGDIARMTSEVGINATNSQVFAEAINGVDDLQTRFNRRRLIEKGPLHPVGGRYVKAMQTAGDMTENHFRTATWIRGMKTTNGDAMGARAFTMMRHGDYNDLTDWESGFVRDLIPFYKWMRTNTPYQIHQLLESPGKLAAVLHAKEAAYGAVGIDYEKAMQDMPPWMAESFSFPLPGGRDGNFKAITLDLPMSDLYKGTGEYLSSFLPLIKPFAESYVLEKSLFSGAPLTEKAKAQFDVPIVSDILGAVGIGERTKDGKLMLDEKTLNVIGVIPAFSRFRDWIFADPDRAKLKANVAASAFFGVGIRPVDKEVITNDELGFYYQNILPEMDRLKSLGYELPTKDDLQQAGVIAQDLEDATFPDSATTTALDELTV